MAGQPSIELINTLDNRNVAVSTLKPSEDSNPVILRLRSVSDRPETLKLGCPAGEPKSLRYFKADETPREPVDGEIPIPPPGAASLRIEFKWEFG